MSLPVAFCIQVDDVIDIVRAHHYYYSQKEPRPELGFLCPDEDCRKLYPQTVQGVNYNKLPKECVQKSHFRLIKPERHRTGCPWIEITTALDELDAEAPERFSNLKASEVIDVFDPACTTDEEEDFRIDAAQVEAISALATRRARIDAYKAYLKDNPNRTSRLTEVASCFRFMTPEELKRTQLKIEGVGEKNYRQFFTSAEFCTVSSNATRIYYGTVGVAQCHEGFKLTFYKLASLCDGRMSSVNVLVSNEMLNRHRGKAVVLALLKAGIEIGRNALFCSAFGHVECIEGAGKPELFVQIGSLHSLALMFKESGRNSVNK